MVVKANNSLTVSIIVPSHLLNLVSEACLYKSPGQKGDTKGKREREIVAELEKRKKRSYSILILKHSLLK